MQTKTMAAGGYHYIPGVMQYSAGVAALDGYRIVRARFFDVVPMKEGFERIAAHLAEIGRPPEAFCACEMRSPGQFSEEGFAAFNTLYAKTLIAWNIMEGDDNPVARSNICPEIVAPEEPGFHAFCYTVKDDDAPKTFAIAGSGEVPEGKANYRDHIVRPGETSPDAIREKAAFVLDEMERRMGFFGGKWADTTAAQIYSVHDIHPLIETELAPRGVHRNGLAWHYNRPPIVGLEYEMDCRRVFDEIVL
ncbi:2-amino-5-chloromuconate deaminase CnbZ [Martelella sp. FOR1707]